MFLKRRYFGFIFLLTAMSFAGSQVGLVYENFNNTNGLTLFGSAQVLGNEEKILNLTPKAQNMLGGFYTTERVDVEGFHISFRVTFNESLDGEPDCNNIFGADGMALVIQDGTNPGEAGGGLGFGSIEKSIAVEIDTYCNNNLNEPNSHHIAIMVGGVTTHMDEQPFIDFGQARDLYVWVDYDGAVLEVRHNTVYQAPDEAQLSQVIDIPDFFGSKTAHVGFLGATGGGTQDNCLFRFTYHPQVPPPLFFKPDWVTVSASGELSINVPRSNPDGVPVPENDRLGYGITRRKDCDTISGNNFYLEQSQFQVTFPFITYPFEGGPYQVHINRVFESNFFRAKSQAVMVEIDPTLPRFSPQNHLDFDRWLLHVPSRRSGFKTTVKFTNPRSDISLDAFLTSFNQMGDPLGTTVITVPPNATQYHEIYETLFTASVQDVSHAGIQETSGLMQIDMAYESISTGYAAWTSEADLTDGEHVGYILEIDPAAPQFLDGIAVANLRNHGSVNVFVEQRNRETGDLIADVFRGELQPGEKTAFILSTLFEFNPNAVYRVTTRNPRHYLQAVGLSFNGFDFFSTKPIRVR